MNTIIKIWSLSIIIFMFSGCANPEKLKTVSTTDRHFSFEISEAFEQENNGSVTHISSYSYKNWMVEVYTRDKGKEFDSFEDFSSRGIRDKYSFNFRKTTLLPTIVTNKNAYPIVSYLGKGRNYTYFFNQYMEGYTYAIETPHFYVQMELIYRDNAHNKIDYEEAKAFMRPVLESFTEISH